MPNEITSRSTERRIPSESDIERVPGLVRACHSRMGRPLSPEDLDECVQEASLAVLRQRESFRGDSDLDTWLYGVARVTIIRALAKRQTRRFRQTSLASENELPARDGPSPVTLADTGVVRSVKRGLQEFGTTLQRILALRHGDGLSFSQIGKDMGMNETTVKSRYYRALPSVKARFEELWRAVRK